MACILLLPLAAAEEPAYQGKPLSHWIELLKDKNPTVRREAAGILWNFGCVHGKEARVAVPALDVALKDESPSVRVAAAQAMWSITKDADRCLPVLTEALRHNESRASAAGVLSLMGTVGLPSAPSPLRGFDAIFQFCPQVETWG
ncbi:MAG: HEAT repeat domain-containing protein [Planctomycetota bacterium]|nr:HEAT repeat domain-containing protein [Planctomycetota bacterium]